MKQKILALFVLFYCSITLYSQNTIGLPEVINYPKQLYKAGAQNREIKQDRNGIIYIANSEGLITYNGVSWTIYPLPNKSIVRSIEFGPDNNLYVGGQDEVGYFSPSENGTLQYYSLKPLIAQAERSFADVWEICVSDQSVFFQTSDKILQLTGKNISIYKDPHWLFMGEIAGNVVAQSSSKGLVIYEKGLWSPYLQQSPNALPAASIISSFTNIGRDSLLVTTIKDGIYLLNKQSIVKFKSPALDLLQSKNISCSNLVNDHQIAIGTNLDGCFIIDKGGNLIRSFGRKEGLQNNNIQGIFLDAQKNLWLGLHNGIDFIAYNNSIKHIYPIFLNEGAGYASQVFGSNLFIGTSIGLFKVQIDKQTDITNSKAFFEIVKNTEGEVWNLSEVNNKLLMGHNEGAFLIEGNSKTPLDQSTGYWGFKPFYNVLPSSIMVAGNYNGLNFFNYNGSTFTKSKILANIESARFVVVDNNKVWFSHPYKGIYNVQVKDSSPVIKKYGAAEGVALQNGNYLFKIKNALILTTEKGVFKYNTTKNLFEPSVYYNSHLPNIPIRYMKEDAQGNIWFVFEKKIGVLELNGTKPQIIYFPELTNKFVAGFEHINPIDKNNVLIGGEKGFYHVNYEQYKKLNYKLHVKITSVTAVNYSDSLLFGGYASLINDTVIHQKKSQQFGHSFHSFRFEFAAPVYGQQSNIEYSYVLQGFDAKWSEYAKKTGKEYTNLPPGKYVFKVKARNNFGNESEINTYSFTVLPPWYQTNWAYALYLILFLVGNYLLFRYLKIIYKNQQRRHAVEQKRMQYLHQLEMEKAEKEMVTLRNEKLEAEIQNKNTELASTAMHLVQKGDLLSKIKDQMIKLKDQGGAVENEEDLKKIMKTLSNENKMDEQWHQFALHFDTTHSDFLNNLKNIYPTLTTNEHKLCAYLKMNFSTKEIAQLMNISVRGVEVSRYRLRKKLEIPSGTNFSNFLDSIG